MFELHLTVFHLVPVLVLSSLNANMLAPMNRLKVSKVGILALLVKPPTTTSLYVVPMKARLDPPLMAVKRAFLLKPFF